MTKANPTAYEKELIGYVSEARQHIRNLLADGQNEMTIQDVSNAENNARNFVDVTAEIAGEGDDDEDSED